MVNPESIENWHVAKILIQKNWSKVKESELEQTYANFDKVVTLLQQHYHLPRKNLESELLNLIDQIA